MQFYRFWTRAKATATGRIGAVDATCYGYSNESLEDALRVAEERASATAKLLAEGDTPGFEDGYYENGRAFTEEIVEEFTERGEQIAIISRNNYGALILNTPCVFFADVDKPPSTKPKRKSLFDFLLKRVDATLASPTSFESELIDKINGMCRLDQQMGLRLYRTMAGYRIVLTNEQIPSSEARSRQLLQALGADRLYISLCRSQDCYRARLTPKPWRCQFSRPRTKFPYRSVAEENEFRVWEKKYSSAIERYATCALVGQFGSETFDPVVEKIVQLHDHYVLDGDKPLA